MSADEIPVVLAREWVEKAESDLINAVHALKLGKHCPADTVCFHAQQCAEKYLKAFLTFMGIAFPKTHEIERLMKLLPQSVRLSLTSNEQDRLTAYATVTRYPGDYIPVTLAQAREAVKMARRVRTEIRQHLPKETTRQRRKEPPSLI